MGKQVWVSAARSVDRQFEVGKANTDTSLIAENYVADLSKIVSDASSAAESKSLAVSKPLSDSSSASESIALQTTFIRAFSDSAFATDDVDGEASIQDDQEMQFTKVRSEIALVAETAVKSSGKAVSDSGLVSDAGSFRGQGYCDFDYFADDYVGFSGTF